MSKTWCLLPNGAITRHDQVKNDEARGLALVPRTRAKSKSEALIFIAGKVSKLSISSNVGTNVWLVTLSITQSSGRLPGTKALLGSNISGCPSGLISALVTEHAPNGMINAQRRGIASKVSVFVPGVQHWPGYLQHESSRGSPEEVIF